MDQIQSNLSSENTLTSQTKLCACGAKLEGEWCPEAQFNGRVVMAAQWVWPDKCNTCKGKRDIVPFDPVSEKRSLVKKLTEIFNASVPAEEYTFERFNTTFDNNRAFMAAKEFNPSTQNIFLWGTCGVGKTHLACAIVREAVKKDLTAIFMKPSRLMRYMRVKEADLQEARIKELARVDVLVIDELGLGKETEFARQILQEILDMRELNRKCGLVITGNYSLEEYATKLGEDPIPSRLAGMCNVVLIGGDDMRLKKRVR